MLETEYKYYQEHLEEFLREHHSAFVVIQGETVKGFYPTENEGIKSMAGEELGTFFVKQCLPISQTTVEYHSRAVFA